MPPKTSSALRQPGQPIWAEQQSADAAGAGFAGGQAEPAVADQYGVAALTAVPAVAAGG
ncbi:hypothetical protein [Mycobacterium simiae]|uniref:hypothetical protein n=1 Tax=Mycobacterium simiae TaxID=1784 RepID=UPI00165FA685|nr:hypothetical protein [Mycobacterium simiae]